MLHGIPVSKFKTHVCCFLPALLFFFFNYMGALSACTSAHQRGVSDVCELPCGCWESNSGPSEGQ